MPEPIQWTVLTLGTLSRNRFWGEDDSRACRSPLCTSVLLRTSDAIVIVDPPLPPDEMRELLDRRAGLRAEDITHVYLTHFHGDHRVGIQAFPNAVWLMPAPEIALNRAAQGDDRALLDRLTPVPGEGHEILPGLQTMYLPGHTMGLAGLRFTDPQGFVVVVASDAAMTHDFFNERVGYFNSADHNEARRSIDRLHREADIVIPGHDNYFFNRDAEPAQ